MVPGGDGESSFLAWVSVVFAMLLMSAFSAPPHTLAFYGLNVAMSRQENAFGGKDTLQLTRRRKPESIRRP